MILWGRCTVLRDENDIRDIFTRLATLLGQSRGTFNSTLQEREAIIHEITQLNSLLKANKTLIAPYLKKCLELPYYQDIGMRILAQVDMPELALEILHEAAAKNVQMSYHGWRYLWKAVKPSYTDYQRLKALDYPALNHAREAILSSPTQDAQDLLEAILTDADAPYLDYWQIHVLSMHRDKAMLQRVFMDMLLRREQSTFDVGLLVDAAEYLAASGSDKAISLLATLARDADLNLASNAAYALAELGQPSAIDALAAFLDRGDLLLNKTNYDAWVSIVSTIGSLGTPLLVERLLDMVSSSDALRQNAAERTEVVRTILFVVGDMPNLSEDYVMYSIPPCFTERYITQAVAWAREAMSRMSPRKRYWSGQPLTLERFANQLLNSQYLDFDFCALQLVAITGEDYGVDTWAQHKYADNFDAIKQWLARSQNPYPLEPGGWAFRGVPISLDSF